MGERGNNNRAVARTRKMRARSFRLIRFFLAAIVVAIAFVAGFAFRGQTALLQSLGFPASVTGISQTSSPDASAGKDVFNSVSQRVAEVEQILDEKSLSKYDVDQVSVKALDAFGEGTDSYLRYYSPDRYAKFLNNEQSEGYVGVGVLFSEYNGQAYVVDVFGGSPAQREGVQEGDFVVAVNGDRAQTWSRNEVTAMLSQSKGTTVVITWRRPESLEAEGGEEFTTSLECGEYDEVNVTSEYDEERSVGYVKVKQLTQNAATLVKSAVENLAGQGARAFVLDLRGNPGGFLTQAIGLASLFMSGGSVVVVQTKDGQNAKPTTGQPVSSAPLVVLVNKHTASAAEVVAAAFKESQRATLVGTTTAGKGSVQMIDELSFGGAIRYTAARYLTPEGHDIDQVGVTPDVPFGAGEEGDPQKDYALEVASSQIVVEPSEEAEAADEAEGEPAEEPAAADPAE